MAVCLLLRSLVVLPSLFLWLAEANRDHSFSIQQVARADRNLPLNISTVFARNFLRYGGVVPPIVARSAETASVLAGTRNGEFIIPVSVGADTLYMSVDTGSADLWVFSRELRQNQSEIHGVYKPSVYSSKSPGKSWAISYADGTSASGDVYYDVVGIDDVWVMQQAVEVATRISRNLEQDDVLDGILGLGFSNLNRVKPEREKTFFENAKSQLELPLFAAILKHDNVGTYDFGFINSSKYTGELSYVDVDSSHGHWSFKLSGYDLGSGEIANDPLESVIDTGASLIFLPDYIVDAYYQQIIGAEKNAQVGEWTVPCSAYLPSFTVVVGEYKAVILGDLLKLDPIKKSSLQCIGGIQSNMGAGVGIFGHVFLKTQYVVFDDRGPQLGFASQS